MSKTQQRLQTQYSMGYSDGLRGVAIWARSTLYNNQYKLGHRHGTLTRNSK